MSKTLTRSAVRIYASLSALGSGSSDILQQLLPFFEPILRPKQGLRFDIDAFASEIREMYSWNFNTDIVEVFIPRFVDSGWLVPENPKNENTTYTIYLPEQISESSVESSVSEQLREVAEQFKVFSESLSPLTAIPRDVEEFEDILIEWLLYVEAFSEYNLNFKSEVKNDRDGKLRQIIKIPETTSLGEEEKFLCARFVQHIIRTDANASEVLANIASIGLLTEVVQDFVKPSAPVAKSNLVIYLDAPVALELLGVSGTAARENIQPIISELQKIGVSIRVYGQSIDEIKQSLQAVLSNAKPTGPTAVALSKGEAIKEFVVGVAANPQYYLKEAGVEVTYRTLEQIPNEHQYFTNECFEDIYSALTFQQKVTAREHDATITTLAMRQRRGFESTDIFESRFLVLTRNGLLAQLSRRECLRMGYLAPTAVPPVVHRRVLAAAMWLRTGLGANSLEIPKRMLLASCESVLAIRPGVVDAVKRLTDALGDEEKTRQLDLLIATDRSAQMLMDKTLGAPSVVTEANLSQLFDEMLYPHLEDERRKGEDAVKQERAKARKSEGKLNEQLRASRDAEKATAKVLKDRLNEDLEIVESLFREIEKKLSRRRRIKKVLGLIMAATFCVPTAFDYLAWQYWLGLPFAIVLAYLTIIGSKIIGTLTSNDQAMSALEVASESRRLTAKMSRFDIKWNGERFSATEASRPLADDLLASELNR